MSSWRPSGTSSTGATKQPGLALQLLAYRFDKGRVLDVGKSRNLAKSVTVD